MKTNRIKAIGITVGVCAALWLAPNTVGASDDGNSLNLDINLLNKKEGKATIVDIQIDAIPIVGDLKVKLPSKHTEVSETEGVNQKDSALATVELGGGDLVEDLNVSVLENTTSENATSDYKKSSLASVGLTTPLTEDVDVDVLSSKKENDSTKSSLDGGLVEVNAPNLPILGETHVGVLDKHTNDDGEINSLSAGLVQANLDGDLLKDTAVKVLATEHSSNEKRNEKTAALVSAKVDEESLGGIVEDLDVSVLENTTSENATSNHQKSSLASVGLTTPLTEDVDIDVLSSERANDSTSSSFDGGLVEVNASDLPILGETHVGVLDKHTMKDEESYSVSAGLVQANLDGDLLRDTAINVLAMNKSTDVTGTTVETDGVFIQVGTQVVDPVKVGILTTKQFYPDTGVIVPTPDTGDENDQGIINPGTNEGDNQGTVNPDAGNGNGQGTVNPGTGDENDQGTVNPGTGDGNDQGIVNPGTGDENDQGTVNPGTGNGNDQGIVNPGIDQGLVNPSTDDDNPQGPEGAENGQVPGTDDQNDETSSNDSFIGVAGGSAGDGNSTPDQQFGTTSEGVNDGDNLDAAIGFANSADAPSSANFAGNMGAVLPKTGGLVDGTLLLLLSLLLLASGLLVRRAAA